MRFRWVALLTLWTMLSGPMLAEPAKGERGARNGEAPRPNPPRNTNETTAHAE
jgi:hypothetical protein